LNGVLGPRWRSTPEDGQLGLCPCFVVGAEESEVVGRRPCRGRVGGERRRLFAGLLWIRALNDATVMLDENAREVGDVVEHVNRATAERRVDASAPCQTG
jgi:hypothetical protein